MCGRATLTTGAEEIAEIFDVEVPDVGAPRFNVAPTQPVPLVRSSTEGGRECVLARWGLIPWFAKDKAAGGRGIQARAEGVRRTPQFRDAWKRHRGLVVLDGFYEWTTLPDGTRVPRYVRRTDRKPFAIAGLWDRWRPEGGEAIESCAVITTRSAGELAEVHDRMPLVLPREDWDAWMTDEDAAAGMLKRTPALDRAFVVVPVSTWVNDVKHDDAKCIEELG